MRAALLLLIASAMTFPLTSHAAPWQVRYAQVADQTEEWTQLGRVPGWTLDVSPDGNTLSLGGDEKGAFRGVILVGREWEVPAARRLQVKLEYQTFCQNPGRSGELRLAVLTPEGWDLLAKAPAQARKSLLRNGEDGVLWQALIHPQGEDVTQWQGFDQAVPAAALRAQEGRKVMLALVWLCYHFEPEWAKVRNLTVTPAAPGPDEDAAYLQDLKLDLPALAPVREALERKDTPGAIAAYVDYMRQRRAPAPLPAPTDAPAGVLRQAEETLSHVYRLAGCPPTTLATPLRWDEDPHNYDQFPVALNRHMEWLSLGRAYAATHDEKYAREFVTELNGWLDAMPTFFGSNWIEGPYYEPGRSPLTLDAGIRMAQSWWQAYGYLKQSPSFDTASQWRMLRSFRDHALYLADKQGYHPESNWGAMETNGLFHIAVLLPELRSSEVWLQTARERLVECLQRQVYPDGAQMELAPGYHGVTLSNFVGALQLARANKVELPAEFQAGLERMYEYYLAIGTPDRRMPALNDSGWGGIAGYLKQGLELFPAREDFRYVLTDGAEGRPPAKTSWSLPYAGFHVMRSGWNRQDRYLLFETGPYGLGHQHEDQLGVIAQIRGETLLTEAGVYSYDRSDWRRYVLSSRGHNVVRVDDLEQHRAGRRDTYRTDRPYDNRWFTSADFDFAQGTYDSGFGPDNSLAVRHARQVLYVKPHYWLIVDRLVPADAAEHRYEALFHFDAAEAKAEGGGITVAGKQAGLRLLSAGPVAPEVALISGQKEPTVQGWLPTGRHNELRAIPTAAVRWRAQGPTLMVHALVPVTAGRAEVTSLRTGQADGVITVEADLPAGGRDYLRLSPDGALSFESRTPEGATRARLQLQ